MADRSRPAAHSALVEEARKALVASGGYLTVAELATQTGRSRDAVRKWIAVRRNSGQLVTVRRGRELLVPAFQLTAEGNLDPAAANVVSQLTTGGMTGWAVWRWAASSNTWLGGAVPSDVLQTDPAAVTSAAVALFQ